MSLICFIVDRTPSCLIFDIKLSVINSRLFYIVIKDENLFTNMIYSERVMFMYLYFISGGIAIRVAITAGDAIIVVFPFRHPKFGPNMSSDTMM